jgi:hypothetical protein
LDPICGFVLITNSKMSFFNTITCSMVSWWYIERKYIEYRYIKS